MFSIPHLASIEQSCGRSRLNEGLHEGGVRSPMAHHHLHSAACQGDDVVGMLQPAQGLPVISTELHYRPCSRLMSTTCGIEWADCCPSACELSHHIMPQPAAMLSKWCPHDLGTPRQHPDASGMPHVSVAYASGCSAVAMAMTKLSSRDASSSDLSSMPPQRPPTALPHTTPPSMHSPDIKLPGEHVRTTWESGTPKWTAVLPLPWLQAASAAVCCRKGGAKLSSRPTCAGVSLAGLLCGAIPEVSLYGASFKCMGLGTCCCKELAAWVLLVATP